MNYVLYHKMMYCVTKFLIILVLVLRFCLSALCESSLIVYYELTTFPHINLMSYLCMYLYNYYYYYYYYY